LQFVVIPLVEWKEGFLKGDYSLEYKKQILAKIPLIFSKSVYKNNELVDVICDTCDDINKSDRAIKLVRLILNWCEEKTLLTEEELATCRKKIKNKPSGIDNYVPTDQEVKETLDKLTQNNKLLYLIYLFSGIRKVEGKYLKENIKNLKYQEIEGFVKISMNYLRKNKNSYFCYLPKEIYEQLAKNHQQLSISSLESYLTDHKLIPIKYCRKWFYTKCIELGIPDTIADYYQGRSAKGVGNNHYLSRQLLADKNYSKMTSYLKAYRP